MVQADAGSSEDSDLKLLRASAGLLDDLTVLLPKLLWKRAKHNNQGAQVHRLARKSDVDRVISKIEPFQEDPQLLDPCLSAFLQELVSAYIATLKIQPPSAFIPALVTLRHAICRILYTLCKVRGEKVITGFFNNEPRYLEPLLAIFEHGTQPDEAAHPEEDHSSQGLSWEERYILLLWLSHQLLAPFDLGTISSFAPEDQGSQASKLELPPELPGIPLRVIPICFTYLASATRERTAAAVLLVRLCLRPDMQQVGLLGSVIRWALAQFQKHSEDGSNLHACLGILLFLSKLVASANNDEIGAHLPSIFNLCQSIMTSESPLSVRSSAVARKLVIKISRCAILMCLSASSPAVDIHSVLEDVIGFLLESLADGDTPVRYAASKALSIVTMQLQSGLAAEVVEAILGSFNEDVLWVGSSRNLNAVNPLRWHGLTLTLAHLLYRRAISCNKLPEILNALLLALNFEQRSATGSSIGTNVRDAANFGLWAVSRRYTVAELKAVRTNTIRASKEPSSRTSVTQMLAIELIESACLDPVGNIRRGSSAALQELIGRHPDTVIEGIPLVQIVDYHAVGLRRRAAVDVAVTAAKLSQMYWDAVFHAALGWKGIGALDGPSRQNAAMTIGRLWSLQSDDKKLQMLDTIQARIRMCKRPQIEERHGLVLALACLLEEQSKSMSKVSQVNDSETSLSQRKLVGKLNEVWSLLDGPLGLEDKDIMSAALRPELTAVATCEFLKALSTFTLRIKAVSPHFQPSNVGTGLRLLRLCLHRSEESVLESIPSAVQSLAQLLDPSTRENLAVEWCSILAPTTSLSSRKSGHVIALGALFPVLKENGRLRKEIVRVLTTRCTPAVDIEARVLALRSIILILPHLSTSAEPRNPFLSDVGAALKAALNDYTVNERGDVGSLVRLQALDIVEAAWKLRLIQDENINSFLRSAVVRLALEKLDKVRSRAAACLSTSNHLNLTSQSSIKPLNDEHPVSSYAYFRKAFEIAATKAEDPTAVIQGYISSAGMGTESVLQASRKALCDGLALLPLENSAPDHPTSTLTLTEFANIVLSMLRSNLSNDRILLPVLETLAFLFDMRILQRLTATTPAFPFRTLFTLIQKAHFRSANLHKLHVALDLYRGLASVDDLRPDVLKKVASMLLHPFPKIRLAAAETLWVLTQNEELRNRDWTALPKGLKDAVERIRREVSEEDILGR